MSICVHHTHLLLMVHSLHRISLGKFTKNLKIVSAFSEERN